MSKVTAGLIAFALLLVLAAAQAEQSKPKAVGNVAELMKAMVIPSSNAIGNAETSYDEIYCKFVHRLRFTDADRSASGAVESRSYRVG